MRKWWVTRDAGAAAAAATSAGREGPVVIVGGPMLNPDSCCETAIQSSGIRAAKVQQSAVEQAYAEASTARHGGDGELLMMRGGGVGGCRRRPRVTTCETAAACRRARLQQDRNTGNALPLAGAAGAARSSGARMLPPGRGWLVARNPLAERARALHPPGCHNAAR